MGITQSYLGAQEPDSAALARLGLVILALVYAPLGLFWGLEARLR